MKCRIVTVYNSDNSGSFLQAYAMMQTLKKMGHQAVFSRNTFSDHNSSLRTHLIRLAKLLARRNLMGFRLMRERRKNFRAAVSRYMPVEWKGSFDCCVLGSDVIWDLTKPFFKNHADIFWGWAFEGKKVISYAASLGFAGEKELKAHSFVRGALNNMAWVSVRDRNSQALLQPYCDQEIRLVCDPTFLVERQEYDAIAAPTKMEKFIFLYCYVNLPSADQAAIQALAKKEGLKTVTFGQFNQWCDVHLPYDPLEFLSLYEKADYIITDTFHGTVFSMIYEKRFAVVKNQKIKVLDVLAQFGMADKMTSAEAEYAAILHSDFDYASVRQRIAKEREKGLCYLNCALEEVKK